MRTSPLAIANLVLVVAVAGSTLAAYGAGRESTFKSEAAALEQRWTAMSADGVPKSALEPLEASLRNSPYEAKWWSPTWWNDSGSHFLQSLEAATTAAWDGAIAGARARAVSAIAGWAQVTTRDAAFLPSTFATTFSQWQTRFRAASTPAAIEGLSTELLAATSTERSAGTSRQAALVSTIPANQRNLMLSATQAGAEGIPGASGFIATYRQIAHAIAAKPDTARLAGLGVEIAALETTVTASLKSHACGHDEPSGKAIVINLTLQEVVFYQDGCALQAAPVTSGRNLERTPTGTFHVFHKDSPVLFTSWAPRGSPFWYPPERADYALEFTVVRAGIFLHDAPWEPLTTFGQGSENTSDASHGCVHAPTSVMAWAYSWAPLGTPVIVTD
jgi:lipoprotein-anchoring transpeptidase ErfK/SrfK